MHDPSRTYQEVIEENALLRQRIQELELSELALKQAEEILREREEQLRLIVEHSTDVICMIDRNNKILFVSPPVERWLGYKAEEFIGQSIVEVKILSPECFDQAYKDISSVFSGNTILASEYVFIARDGSRITSEVSGAPLMKDGVVTGLISVARNITERKIAEKSIEKIGQRMLLALEGTDQGIWELDLVNRKLNFFSNHWHKILGYELGESEFDFKWWRKQMHSESRPVFEKALLDYMSGHTKYLDFHYQIRNKTGEWQWIHALGMFSETDETGFPIRMVGTHRNVTERKKSEEALRESEKQYHALFEAIADTVFLIDQETGSIIDVNPAATRMYGFNREEFLRMTTADVWSEPEKTAQAAGEPVPFIPLQYHRHKDGSAFSVELTASLFELQGRKTIIATARDITEREKIEEERKQLELQRQQLQKAESLSRMAGAIAHNFNNQLGVVIGNLEMAIDALPQDAEPVTKLTISMQAAWKAAEMSGLMLTYLGQTVDERELLDLSQTCLRSLPIIQAVIPGKVDLKTALPSTGPVIMANASQIQQIMGNLATNAWEAIGKDRGVVRLIVKTVSPAEIPSAHRFPIGWQPQDTDYACLEVTDTGSGIAADDLDKLFDPFFSNKFTGRGLGLSVVLGIVKAHSGAITVESEPDRGSTFRVFLPVSAEMAASRSPEKAPHTPEIEWGGTVLIVDDEDMVRDMAKTILRRLGFSILEAHDGVEAVEVFRQQRDEIRLVLCDLTMPRMDGWETLTALRKLAPDFPVILVSGYDKAHVMSGDHPEWPQVFLGKPYRLKGLSDAISQALANRK